MKFPRHDLQADKQRQCGEEERGSGQITPVEGHRDGIAAGLTQRCSCNFNDPESEGYFGDLVE